VAESAGERWPRRPMKLSAPAAFPRGYGQQRGSWAEDAGRGRTLQQKEKKTAWKSERSIAKPW
jgi:hypothetical protein